LEPTYLAADALASALSDTDAITELEKALLGHVDPEQDFPRLFNPAPDGEFLIMPSSGLAFSGVKLATIAPQNPRRGLPKIQGIYALFDSRTLAPLVVMDGAELTLIRTPATTALAIKHILASGSQGQSTASAKPTIGTLVVFGTGPQAWRHVRATQSILSANTTIVVGRNEKRTESFANYCRSQNINTEVGDASCVASADLIICASSSSTPLFDNSLIQNHTVIAAVGSHGLDAREIDPQLARRANIVVESRQGAMREAGDLIPARSVEEWRNTSLTNLAELVRGSFTRNPARPTLYTGAGMAWQDLVIASAIYARLPDRQS
jgi:1-piperideine-2-carboxylate/1-pyrroline-2-carboxylate reductase [NAD(P)H]